MLYDFIVIGAGAAGLFMAARFPGSVLLLERQNRAGRKILLSGGGKCNVSNRQLGPENYYSRSLDSTRLARWLTPALQGWTAAAMQKWLEEQNIALEEREHGQLFCRRGAEELRDRLLELARQNGAELKLGQEIQAVRHWGEPKTPAANAPRPLLWSWQSGGAAPENAPPDNNFAALPAACFEVTSNNRSFFGRRLLLASGGPAWPKAGATSFAASLARAAGHKISAPRPALTPLFFDQNWPLHGLQGLSLEAKLSWCGPAARAAPSFTLPLLFTHKGLSGPACLQISTYLPLAAQACAQAGTQAGAQAGESCGPQLEIDFLPGCDLAARLDAPEAQRSNLQALLRKLLPERLTAALLQNCGLADFAQRKLAELSRAQRKQAVAAVKALRCAPLLPGFEQAESSSGGIELGQVNPARLESRLWPGLHFCGEALDVCGQLGGYNLHWAWASGKLAADISE